jgi:hypothetical protein
VVLRLVLIRLKPEYRSDGEIRRIARHALEVLPRAARVMDVTARTAADATTRGEWDLCILVRFASMQDPDVYRVDPIHRAFTDVFLKPFHERVAVYHFEDYQPLIPVRDKG